MDKIIVRYKLKPGMVEENERLVKEVYKQLHEVKPKDFQYATYKLEDGLTFVHFALHWGKSPLADLEAFKNFQADIKSRCDELPVLNHVTEIGSYNMNNELIK